MNKNPITFESGPVFKTVSYERVFTQGPVKRLYVNIHEEPVRTAFTGVK
jgi:hypothetical protein